MDNELETVVISQSKEPLMPPKRAVFSLPIYGLLTLAVLYTLYFAKSLLMPILVAMLFALLLSPLVSLFKRLYIPRSLSAVFLIAMIGGPMTLLSIELAGPAQKWMEQVPKLSAQLTKELDNLSQAISADPVAEMNKTVLPAKKKSTDFFGWFSSDDEPIVFEEKKDNSALSARVTQGGIDIIMSILVATPMALAQFMTFLILVMFLLIFGPGLYASYLKILPLETSNRRSATLIGKLQKELSRYIVTVTIINAGLGITTAGIFWMMGVDDALLWGVLVGLLNFAPYLGSIMALIILSFAGITQYGIEVAALMPAAVYFGINMLEAQFITPTVLGRHMQLNPLILILWLLIWGWLWGAVGVLVAVPLLVCIKLAAAQLNVLSKWVALIETSS
ncbi:MAG: AI-2E family transporter [Oleispira antarctica]|nr:AI-2E family transporter [Oleispira antarctica]MBQ0791913.1 AI-2E family transporter [Oleispira antarctica]